MTEKFDIGIIGAGPGGYSAAIRASQRGKSVVLFEKDCAVFAPGVSVCDQVIFSAVPAFSGFRVIL